MIDASNRQYLIRTMLGEAANQSDEGMAGVAHVILNRAKDDRWGNDVRSVVLAKNQFEPWNDPAAKKRMLGYRTDSEEYQRAARIADGVLSGDIADMTGGADHFLNADIVRQRRGGSLPSWAEQMWDTRQVIGDHTFLGGSGADTLAGDDGWVEVTDPAILEQLNAPDGDWIEVTDPAILAQLNGEKAPAAAAPAPREDAPYTEAATVMVNDLNAGFQGVNPVAVAKSQPLGVVDRDQDGSVIAIDVDGVKEDPSKFPGSRYVTQVDPKSGMELVYLRTEDIADPAAASAGRVLGFGLPNAFPSGKPAAAPVPPTGAEALGITPSLAMTGKTGAMLASAGDSFIGTSGVIAKDAARASDEITAAAGRIADDIGPGINQADGGEAIRKGSQKFVDAFEAKSASLYSDVDKLIPQGATIEVRNTAKALEDALKQYENTPNMRGTVGLSELKGWADDLLANDGRIPWETVKALRGEIGAAIGKMKGPMANQGDARLKALYSSLTDDMAAGAKEHGALGAWHRANTFYAKGQKRIGEALDFVFKKGASDERLYDQAFALTASNGGRANIRKLNNLKKSMPPEEWASFVGTVVRRIGRSKPGAAGVIEGADDVSFSASTFLTNWNKMAPEARAVLFRGKGLPKTVGPALDQLAQVADTVKEGAGKVNRSNTSIVTNAVGLSVAGAANLPATIGAVLIANLSARAMTMPGVLRAVASASKHGNLAGLKRLADGKGPAAVEATNMLRLVEQTE